MRRILELGNKTVVCCDAHHKLRMYTKEVWLVVYNILSILLSNPPSPVVPDFEAFHNGNPPP
jgi:hypothetical protein